VYALALFGSFPRSETDDPETYLSAVERVFRAYPDDIVKASVDPLTGLPRKHKFPPNIFEISEELERRMKPLRDAEHQRRLEEFAAEKPRAIDPEEAERRKAFIAKWRADQAREAIKGAVAAGMVLPEMDPRKCRGEMRELVQAATEAHIARKTEEFKKEPVQFSERMMIHMGLDPFVRALRGQDSGAQRTEKEWDDELPD
jgi:hypothetical protein